MKAEPRNPLSLLLGWTVGIAVFLGLAYAGSVAWAGIDANPQHREIALLILEKLGAFGQGGWLFIRPLLQLAIVLVIVDWVMRRLGVELTGGTRPFEWSVQAIIAIIVVAAYAIAELAGLGSGLKDVVLVVVGFYFGTQRHSYEVNSATGQIRKIDDYVNTQVKTVPDPPKTAAESQHPEGST
jgi:hypothetical protein